MTDLHELTALEQGEAIRRGDVSSVELVEHYLARIDAHGQALGAFVTVTADEAMAAADSATLVGSAGVADSATSVGPAGVADSARGKRARAAQAGRVVRARAAERGRDRTGTKKNRLVGVPTAVKDLTLTAGVRTTFGSLAFGEFIPPVDADVVVLMRQAGLISLGKTTTSEFGCALYSESSVAPPARNPWATNCTAGGSSGGAAAAVAAGLVPLAHGNDGGGSLRIPASICGVVGYKPSRGLVSSGPLGFGGFGLPTNGPIARTVADAAAFLDVMAMPMSGEPYPSPTRPPRGFLDVALHPDTYLPKGRPLRIGRYLTPMLADVVPAADVVAVWESAAATLAALDCEIVDVEPPFAPDAEAYFEATWPLLSLAPVPPEKEALLLPLTRWLRAKAREITPDQLVVALAELQVRIRRFARNPGCDILLSPVLARSQAPVGWFTETGDPADDFSRQERFSPYCAAYNFTGQPAISLPVGRDAHGSPIGVMLAAPMGADAQLIAVSALLESAVPWAHQHPPVWSAAG